MSVQSERYYPALDGLRGIAALMIVWYHYLTLSPMHGRALAFLARISGFSWVGVDLFFVLSGFLITGILVESKSHKRFFRTFYARRILRIFPLYYALLVAALIVLPLVGVDPHVPESSRIYYWTYTCNFHFITSGWDSENFLSHLWTLAIEEQFYFVWPLIIYLVPRLDTLRKLLPGIVLAILFTRLILFLAGYDFTTLYLNTLTHSDALLLGSYLALAVRSPDPKSVRWLRPSWMIIVLLLIPTLLLSNPRGMGDVIGNLVAVQACQTVVLFTILAVCGVWLIYAAVTCETSLLGKVLSHRVLRGVGKYSYALYALHVPVGFLVLKSFVPGSFSYAHPWLVQAILLCVYVSACLLAAYLSWHLLEKHFLKLKRYFVYDREQPAMIGTVLAVEST